eukprot:COSAG05_NODE_4909_length_1331_cov_0.757305_2_plen_63_part_00
MYNSLQIRIANYMQCVTGSVAARVDYVEWVVFDSVVTLVVILTQASDASDGGTMPTPSAGER